MFLMQSLVDTFNYFGAKHFAGLKLKKQCRVVRVIQQLVKIWKYLILTDLTSTGACFG